MAKRSRKGWRSGFVPALVLLLVLTFSVLPALGVSDYGNPAITRLYVPSKDGDHFSCTGFYIFPRIDTARAWIVSAGHCSSAFYAKHSQSVTAIGIVNWRAALLNHNPFFAQPDVDLALGTVPDVRDEDQKQFLWLADNAPEDGLVYIHSFPAGVEKVIAGNLVPVSANSQFTFPRVLGPYGVRDVVKISDAFPGTRIILIKRGELGPGSSGAPILNYDGRVIGVLWGGITDGRSLQGPDTDTNDLVIFTPVEKLHALMKLLGVGMKLDEAK